MVKLFFFGIGIFVLVVVGAFSAFFTPLLAGVDRNLGGSPRMPFHSPVPQPVVGAIHNALGQATPPVLLIGAMGLAALLLVYTIGSLVAVGVKRWQERQKRHAELRFRARITIEREQQAQATTATPETEFEALWE